MAAAEECVEPLKYQTWILKVSIHCEGCKKKVKKVLQSMEGVYKTTVDAQQHKVVVTGNVEAEVLIKKLLKAGKHAELWHEKKPNENNSSGSSDAAGGGGGNGKKSKSKNINKPNEPPSERVDNNQISPANDVPSQVSNKPADGEASKNSGKESSPPPKKEDEGEKAATSGGGGKKKAKKDQKENNNNNISNNNSNNSSSNNKNKNGGANGGGVGAADVEVVPQESSNKKAAALGGGVAMPPAFNFPVYSTPQVPSYLVSYSSMQPSMSYGGAYYTALPMMQSSYLYSAPSPASYYTFSEENPNVCSIM